MTVRTISSMTIQSKHKTFLLPADRNDKILSASVDFCQGAAYKYRISLTLERDCYPSMLDCDFNPRATYPVITIVILEAGDYTPSGSFNFLCVSGDFAIYVHNPN